MASASGTAQGQNIEASWDNLIRVYTQRMPTHIAKLRATANRPLKG